MPSKRDERKNTVPNPQYAFLGLHQAAASGNIGLVQYALQQGQPVDAVWDGISALHAAAAGGSEGSERVARLLIDSGADVNLGRQPRNEREPRTRTASASSTSPPIDKFADILVPVDAAEALLHPGSTPLHFAVAHNNVAIARLLLASGATPHVRDDRGVTPVDLLPPAASPSAGSTLIATTPPAFDALRIVIHEYYKNEKAKEKEFQKSQIGFPGKAAAVLGFPRNDDDTKRVGGKRSVENLLSKSPKQAPVQLTSPKHVPVPLSTPSPARRVVNGVGTPPPSPRRPSAPTSERIPPSPTSPSRFTFGNATPSYFTGTPTPMTSSTLGGASGASAPFTPPASEHRRPSLPQLFDTPSPSPSPAVLPRTSDGRPRSAGDGTDPPVFGSQTSGTTPSCGHARPRTKRSLLNLFKKCDYCSDAPSSDLREKDTAADRGRPSFSAGVGSSYRTTDSDEKASMLNVQSYHEEVRTAPPERTSFIANGARVPDEVFCDEEEEYGVPLEPGHGALPHYLSRSPADEEDGSKEDSSGDDEDTAEDGTVRDHSCQELERKPAASTSARVRNFVLPKHAEGWYRDRMGAAQASGSSLGLPPAGLENGSRHGHGRMRGNGSNSGNDRTPPPTSPRTRPGILRGGTDSPMRRSGSRGALRFEGGRQDGQALESGRAQTLRERASRGSLKEKSSRSSLRLGASVGNRHLGVDNNRLRGDSVSSASTDASAPPRSLLSVSQDTSTGTMASSNPMASLPSLDSGRLRDGYPDGLYSSDDEDLDLVDSTALGLSIRTVSNHAQAEALVQQAAKEILELNALAEAPSLSAQLAAYGETLQLERRFARGEAQRFKSPSKARFEGTGPDAGGDEDGDDEEERRREEEERRRKAQERMISSQRTMERYTRERERGSSKERSSRSPEVIKEKEKEREQEDSRLGYPLARTTSLEKEFFSVDVERTKKPRPPKMRRPHTSDSVRSTSSGSTVPRFGHSVTHSTTGLLRAAGNAHAHTHPTRVYNAERRAHHCASRSTSAQQRSESLELDYDRQPSPSLSSSPHLSPPRPGADDLPLIQDSAAEDDEAGSFKAGFATSTKSPFMSSTATFDDYGTGTGSGRLRKQKFAGGLRSLFGKSR